MTEKKYLFISDIHLKQADTQKTKLFCNALEKQADNTEIYMLGDIFDAWLGDDTIGNWLAPIKTCISKLKKNSCNFYIMPGNHDFLLGYELCNYLGMDLIQDPFQLKINDQNILLTHGDTLCDDDEVYQNIRPILQHKITKIILGSLSVSMRKKIASKLQGNSREKTINNAKAIDFLRTNKCEILIHGHIHKPYQKEIDNFTIISLCPWDKEISLVSITNNKIVTLDYPKT